MKNPDDVAGPMPHVPEPVEAQRARYPAAIAEVFDVESIRLGTTTTPGQLRRCVFDSPDGLRLIVSREALAGMGVHLHVSASADQESRLFADARGGRIGIAEFTKIALDRFHLISGDPTPLQFSHLSPKGVPHWHRRLS